MTSDAFFHRSHASPWASTQHLLRDVFEDLQRVAVLEWLIRTPPLVDAQCLAAPLFMSRSLSFTSWIEKFSPPAANDMCSTLVVPTHQVDCFSAGVSVESYTSSSDAQGMVGAAALVYRFVFDPLKNRLLAVAFDERLSSALVRFPTASRSATLKFKLEPFLAALDDALALGRALDWSMATRIEKILAKRSAPLLAGEGLRSALLLYALHGCALFRSSVTLHGEKLQTSLPEVRFVLEHDLGTHDSAFDVLRDFAVRAKMSGFLGVPRTPPLELPDGERVVAEKGDANAQLRIAPAPVVNDDVEQVSYAQVLDRRRAGKEEDLRNRNRAAAKRSNDRRREERRSGRKRG